ncbi:MAG: WD40 repeat domain-containing protein, partial [Pyrinomonadaceae bacterium]|nr:WD40 repeat domain-containing protein [Pyrinomonadaceae bacterium]
MKNESYRRAMRLVFVLLIAPVVCAQMAEQPVLVLQAGHTSTINSVVFSTDGKTFLTASEDLTIKLWDARSGRVIRNFTGHTQGVHHALFGPDGKSIFSAGSDITVRMWDVATGGVVRTFETGEKTDGSYSGSMSVSPDGKFIVASYNKTRVWDVASGQLLHTIDRRLDALTFSPNGKTFAAVNNEKRTAQLFNPQTGELLRELPANPYYSHQPLAFSPDGMLLAVVTRDSTVDLWDWTKSHVTRTFQDEKYVDIPAVTFSPDGQTLLISNAPGRAIIKKYLDLYDVRSGKLSRRIDVSNMERVGDAFQANSVAFHPDGKTFLTAGYINLWRWEVAGNAPPRYYETATEKRSTLVVDPNRKNVLLGVEEGTAKLWDANFSVRSEFADSDGFTTFYFSPDGRIAATNNRSNYYLRFWRTESGQIIDRLEESTDQLQFSPDSQAFAVLKGGNAVYIYDSQTVKLARTLRGHTQDITQIRFTRDGKLLISTGADKTVKLWDWRTGELLKTLTGLTAAPTSLALSPDSSTVAVAANDGNITLWEATTGTLKRSWSAGKIPHLMLAFSPDSKTLATATREAKTQIWDAASGQLRKTLAGDASQDFVTSLAFSPDGQGLVLREEYQGRYTVKLWNINSGQLVRRWQDGLEVRDISFSTDGKALLIAAD